MNKKKLGGFFGALAIALSACAAAPRPIVTPPAPPATYDLVVRVYETRNVADDDKLPGAHVALGGLTAVTDGSGNALFSGLSKGSYQVCVDAPTFIHVCQTATLPGAPLDVLLERGAITLPPLATNGHIFTANGQPWRWRGFSSFQLLDRFAKGEDIQPVLDAYKGFNIARVWPYVPAADWGSFAWDSPSPDVVVAFLKRMEGAGFYVELTLLLDDDPARIPQARALLAALKAAQPHNVVIEIANEPAAHKNTNTAALKADALASGFLVSSGNYEDTRLFYGQWIGFHSSRDGEWPRRAHDAVDYFQGGGPDFPEEPAVKVPSVCDEPARPDQVGPNVADFRAYFATCALLAGGGTYHTQTGKFAQVPTPDEARIAAVVLDALNAFPLDAANQGYRRIDESGRSLRTYANGAGMVRVRPTTKDAPESGWTALDADGILWRR